MYQLVFLSGQRAGAIVEVAGSMIAGRSPDCAIEVPDPNVSRHHSRVEFDGAVLRLIDNGSSNGTWLNETRVTESELHHGDIIRMGETRIRIQRRADSESSSEFGHSSVFGFKEAAGDLSASMSMSMLQAPAVQDAGDLSQRLNVIKWVGTQLSSITKLDDLYTPILNTLFEVFPQAERGFLTLGDTFENLRPVAMRLRKGGTSDRLEVSSSLCKHALQRKELICYTEGGNTDFDQGMSLVSLNIRSAMVVPLMVRDEVLGLLVIDTPDRRRAFTQHDMDMAATVCHQIAIALKNALLLRQVEDEARRRRNLMRYLPRPVVEQMQAGGVDIELGGQTCRGTIFFADVIGFSRIAEIMSPADVVTMMNGFFDRMAPCIEHENGSIDKYMGDCIMACWGIPLGATDSAVRAIASGLNMQNALCGLNSVRGADGMPILQIGVGLETGAVVAGNIGSNDRLEYTVLGNTVNTASRIQAQASRHQVLVGESAAAEAGAAIFGVRMPPVQVKNKTQPVKIVSVRGLRIDDEILLHMPLRIGEHRAVLTRRLADGSFMILHPPECDPSSAPLTADLVEIVLPPLGEATVVAHLPRQQVDGRLRRSLLQLTDPSLGGLIAPSPIDCSKGWDEMQRAATGH